MYICDGVAWTDRFTSPGFCRTCACEYTIYIYIYIERERERDREREREMTYF